MTTYNPDLWQIVKITPKDKTKKTYYRVFACWCGGYTQGDSWKLSSGIVSIEYHEPYWHIHNASGSIYKVHKNATGFTGYGAAIYQQLCNDSQEVDLEIVDIEEAVNGC